MQANGCTNGASSSNLRARSRDEVRQACARTAASILVAHYLFPKEHEWPRKHDEFHGSSMRCSNCWMLTKIGSESPIYRSCLPEETAALLNHRLIARTRLLLESNGRYIRIMVDQLIEAPRS
jgi:hypothetical protein